MALKANAALVFDSYEVQDAGIAMIFRAPDPGAGQPSYWQIFFTDAELSAISTQPQLFSAVTTKLQRKFRASGIASKLDPFIGQSITI